MKMHNQYDDRRSDNIDRLPMLSSLDLLNKLTQLEVLEISKIDFKDSQTITLPSLTYLAIDRVHSPLTLTTPSLSSYRTKMIENVRFVFSENITHLHVGAELSPEIATFKNLEYLCLEGLSDRTSAYLDELLVNHPKLGELSVRASLKRLNDHLSLKERAVKFLEKKDSLRFVLFGVQLYKTSQLDDYKGDPLKLQLANYAKLCAKESRWIRRLNYATVMHFENDPAKIPDDLAAKFDFVREIYVSAPMPRRLNLYEIDEEELLAFLGRFKELQLLIFFRAWKLSENFYLQLAKIQPYIWRLDFGSDQIEYKKIFKFEYLYRLTTTNREHEDLIEKLFVKYENFSFSFQQNSSSLTIEKKDKYWFFELLHNGKSVACYFALQDLFTAMYERFGD